MNDYGNVIGSYIASDDLDVDGPNIEVQGLDTPAKNIRRLTKVFGRLSEENVDIGISGLSNENKSVARNTQG